MVSNAEDIPSRVSAITLPLFILTLMSFCTFKRAVSVDRNCSYADYYTLDKLCA